MIDDAVNSYPFLAQIIAAQVFIKGIDDYGAQVKNKQAAGDPEKRLFDHLLVYVFRLYRFIKIEAAKNNDKKRAE